MNILTLKLSFNLYLNSKVSFFLLNIFNKFIFLFKYLLSYFNSINKIKIFLCIIFLIYGLFFVYLFSKLYNNYLLQLNEYEVKSLTSIINDSSILLKDHIAPYKYNFNYSKQQINGIYNTLGIINYQDFIYLKSKDSQQLNLLCNNFPNLKNKLIDISMEDMFGSHMEVITDINRIFMKSIFKISFPLIAIALSIIIISGYEAITLPF